MIHRIDTEAMQQRLAMLMLEPVEMVAYDPQWALAYSTEERFLWDVLPKDLVLHIAHIGSTAVPGLSAKPIIDVQVGVNDPERVRSEVVPRMTDAGYEFIWRSSIGEREPFYAWFLKRDGAGQRTHHIHMVKPDEASEERLLFRDRLRDHPEEAAQYEVIKRELALHHGNDRSAYTRGKSAFIAEVLRRARFSAG